jgi:hypothetical protein
VVAALSEAVADAKPEAEAEPQFYTRGYGIGYGGYGYGHHGLGYGGVYYGKRESEAEAWFP